ncbi:MAG TPA: acyl-CoA dehydratase activase [Candidatus Cloacimonadota bacterium]|jgi:predicted CoA-substrate-specific enzyme activase|nr:acyl-CoA dehydratase activase [Candidatus Cloacimonadota bacterium]
MMYQLGIDIGSRNSKILIFDSDKESIIYSQYQTTAVDCLSGVGNLLDQAMRAMKLTSSDLGSSCVTGYGRKLYREANYTKSEISCHAAGCLFFFPEARTIIDIGGQDSKVICLDSTHRVKEFVMNDKCAAGTGRFLEMTAIRLERQLSDLAILAAQSDKEVLLNSTCVVFAESEIIGLLSKGESPYNIARAVHLSIARRIYAQMAPIPWEPPVVFTGGVALNSDIAFCLAKILDTDIEIPPDPEVTGALGAAILAV